MSSTRPYNIHRWVRDQIGRREPRQNRSFLLPQDGRLPPYPARPHKPGPRLSARSHGSHLLNHQTTRTKKEEPPGKNPAVPLNKQTTTDRQADHPRPVRKTSRKTAWAGRASSGSTRAEASHSSYPKLPTTAYSVHNHRHSRHRYRAHRHRTGYPQYRLPHHTSRWTGRCRNR